MSSLLVRAFNSNANAYISFTYSNVIMGNTEIQRVRSENLPQDSIICTVIDLKGENTADKMWLFTGENYSRNFDNGSDGRKILGSALNPQIFAVEEDGDYQINSVDNIHNTLIAFQAGQDEEFTMTFSHTNASEKYAKIYLHDLETNAVMDITQDSSVYVFKAQSTPSPSNRFRIVTQATQENINNEDAQISVFNSSNTIYIHNAGNEHGNAYVYDLAGRKMGSQRISPNSVHTINVKHHEVYIVKVELMTEKTIKKLSIF